MPLLAPFSALETRKSLLGTARDVRGMSDHQSSSLCHVLLHQLHGVDQSIVPMQESLPRAQIGPIFLQPPQELLQELDNVDGVDSFVRGDIEVVRDSLEVKKKHQTQCLYPGGMALCFHRPRNSLLKPLHGLLLGFRYAFGHGNSSIVMIPSRTDLYTLHTGQKFERSALSSPSECWTAVLKPIWLTSLPAFFIGLL